MEPELYDKALEAVRNYLEIAGSTYYNLKLTWFCKTLENWKAIVSDISKGGYFYEVTYSGANRDTNVDVYIKNDSVRIKD